MLNDLKSQLAKLVLISFVATIATGQTVRLVNGSVVQGRVVAITDEGLQVRTATGERTFTWDTLAPSTRYYYQPVYRANYNAVLRGLPRSQWTEPPDPLVVEELKRTLFSGDAATKPASAGSAVAAPTVPSVANLEIWSDLQFQNVPPLSSTSFPGAAFRDLERTSFVGFQYGTSSADVIYFAFDSAGSQAGSDTMFVYGPGTEEFKEGTRIKGFKKGTGADRRVTYRKLRVRSQLRNATAIMEFDVETGGLGTNEVYLTVNVELSHEKTRSRFMLYAKCGDLLFGEGWIPVKGLLDLPNLSLSCSQAGSGALGTVLLSMANMIMIPKDGMEKRVSLRVEDENGNVIYRDAVKMDLFPPPVEGMACALRRVTPGNTYSVIAEMDLGPFLGKVEARERLTLPPTR